MLYTHIIKLFQNLFMNNTIMYQTGSLMGLYKNIHLCKVISKSIYKFKVMDWANWRMDNQKRKKRQKNSAKSIFRGSRGHHSVYITFSFPFCKTLRYFFPNYKKIPSSTSKKSPGGAIAQLVRPLTVTPEAPGSILGKTLGIFQRHFQCFSPT